MGNRINTIMQICFFAISGVLPRDEAIDAIKDSIEKTYGKKGEEVVQKNLDSGRSHACASARGESSVSRRHGSDRCRRSTVTERAASSCATFSAKSSPATATTSGERVARRRHLPDRHGAIREAQSRARDSGMGPTALHPMRQVRDGLPARDHPRKVYDPAIWPMRRRHSSRPRRGCRNERPEVHDPGCAGGLHRLRALR